MVEKIIVSPQSVRGHGNIINPKILEDYNYFNCQVTEHIEDINNVNMTVYGIEGLYKIIFRNNIVNANSNGLATLYITLLERNSPVNGATISLTGSDGSVYSGITNSDGLATVTVNNIAGDTIFTASYSNVSINCIVLYNNYIYSPVLDGTENWYSINNNYSPVFANNTISSGCGYLSNGWDNTIDWELIFEYYVTGDNNGYLIIPQGTTARDTNGIQQWYCRQLNFRVNGTSPPGNITNATQCNAWINVRITKINNTLTVYYNNVEKTSWTSSSINNWPIMCIGLDKNAPNNSSSIRNIIVNQL